MKDEAITVAKSRLRVARRAIIDMGNAEDQETFSDYWFVFLTAWKAIYTVLEQGSKSSPQSRQWFGNLKSIRRSDPLLQYLFQARNDEEHGLANSVTHAPGGMVLTLTEAVDAPRITVDYRSGEVEIYLINDTGEKVSEFVQEVEAGPALQSVKDRSGNIYHPPHEHLGKRIDIRPIYVASFGVDYLEKVVDEIDRIRLTLL